MELIFRQKGSPGCAVYRMLFGMHPVREMYNASYKVSWLIACNLR